VTSSRSLSRFGSLVMCAVVIAGIALAGCAIPTQRTPTAIPPSRVPFGLLNHELPTTTTTPPKSVPVQVYLLGANHRLVAESRVVPFPGPLKSVVVLLLQGPTKKEVANGIRTAIPGNVKVISAATSATPALATVNLNEKFGEITGAETELAVAQIVFTVVTQTNLATGVIFQIDGQPISVPMGNGTLTSEPVYLSQFPSNGP
jgi:Sporulation and spore germination